MSNKRMQFLYGDRELIILGGNILDQKVEVIVNSATPELFLHEGLAAKISTAAGPGLQDQCEQLISEYGKMDSGMAVYTDAFNLPYKAIIHAVGPKIGEEDAQQKIEYAVSRSMLLCETNDWSSIAFPVLSAEGAEVPVGICAQAFFRSITSFWDARQECALEKIILCIPEHQLEVFFDAFRDESLTNDDSSREEQSIDLNDNKDENITGFVELSEEEQKNLQNDDLTDWFK